MRGLLTAAMSEGIPAKKKKDKKAPAMLKRMQTSSIIAAGVNVRAAASLHACGAVLPEWQGREQMVEQRRQQGRRRRGRVRGWRI